MLRTPNLLEVLSGVLHCRIAFTIDPPPRFQTFALEAHKVIFEFRARVSYPSEGAKEIAYHQFFLSCISLWYIVLDALMGTSFQVDADEIGEPIEDQTLLPI